MKGTHRWSLLFTMLKHEEDATSQGCDARIWNVRNFHYYACVAISVYLTGKNVRVLRDSPRLSQSTLYSIKFFVASIPIARNRCHIRNVNDAKSSPLSQCAPNNTITTKSLCRRHVTADCNRWRLTFLPRIYTMLRKRSANYVCPLLTILSQRLM